MKEEKRRRNKMRGNAVLVVTVDLRVLSRRNHRGKMVLEAGHMACRKGEWLDSKLFLQILQTME